MQREGMIERTGATIYALGIEGRGVMGSIEILCKQQHIGEAVARTNRIG
jgi:hypothetical protein